MQRKIVKIDKNKCNGCGLCVEACNEGAIGIVKGKAKLLSETYCDGLGTCLAECPQGAIFIEEREAKPFDELAVIKKEKKLACGCPSSAARELKPAPRKTPAEKCGPSQLKNWPVQLNLMPVNAPYFKQAGLLIAADCVPFAYASFHSQLLAGKILLIGCPKLDDAQHYMMKLSEIFNANDIHSITIAFMEVPCCHGLARLVRQALEQSGQRISITLIKIGINGELLEKSNG
ncbi:MAG: 4Fe-4S binding protein [Candidatus Wallbacteria bacterium]|nr:4Fe-4S binding protein [Candidatus Wallbacteria bacterium]